MNSVRRWIRSRLMRPLASLLKQGTSPEKIALCLVMGATISVFPVIGTTTLTCTLVAGVLRLNLPAMLAVNWLFAGVQLALWIPFMRLGENFSHAAPLRLSVHELAALVRSGPWHFCQSFGQSILHAVTGWAIICIPLAAVVYHIILRLLRARLVRAWPLTMQPAAGTGRCKPGTPRGGA